MKEHLFLIGILLFSGTAIAGGFRHYKKMGYEEVMVKAKDGDPEAILELGRRGKKEALPEIKKIAAKMRPTQTELKAHARKDKEMAADIKMSLERKHARASRAARKALAKLGDQAIVREFVTEAKGKGPNKQDAIETLGYIGDPKTAKELISLLDDDGVPDIKRSHHEIPTTNSQIAENALAEMFPDVVESFRKENPGKRFYFKGQWKRWWAKNKSRFK